MPLNMPLHRTVVAGFMLALLPVSSAAEVVELSQAQLRHFVAEDVVLSAGHVAALVMQDIDGMVMDIRGFHVDGQMTYRLVMQRHDGKVIEVLVNGVDGAIIGNTTQLGQRVTGASLAKSVTLISK